MTPLGTWTIISNLKAFRLLETNSVTQLQRKEKNSINRTISFIMINIVVRLGELINISQSEVTEVSGESIA